MFKSIFTKTLYEKRWSTLAWGLGLFAMTLLTMSFYPTFSQTGGLADSLKSLPKSVQGLVGSLESLKTVAGYTGQQIYALRIPLLTLILGISLGVGLLAGDEERGTLQALLTNPISRVKVFWQKFSAIALLLLVANLIVVGAVITSYPIIHDSMPLGYLLQAAIACWLLTLIFAGLAFSLGAATGKKGLSVGIASGVAFLSYLISSLAPSVNSLQDIQKASIFYYYNTPLVTEHGFTTSHLIFMIVILVLILYVGVTLFNRRDLNTN